MVDKLCNIKADAACANDCNLFAHLGLFAARKDVPVGEHRWVVNAFNGRYARGHASAHDDSVESAACKRSGVRGRAQLELKRTLRLARAEDSIKVPERP